MKELLIRKNNEIMENKVVKIILKFKYVIEFALSVLFAFLLFNVIYFKMYEHYFSAKYLIPLMFTTIVLIFNIVINFVTCKKELHEIFLNIMIPIGIMFAIFVLPLKVPDEQVHTYRAYNISNGNIIVKTKEQIDYVPEDMVKIDEMKSYKDMHDILTLGSSFKSKIIEVNNTCSSYGFICYIIPSIAMLVGRLLNMNILVAVILGRLLNFIAFILIGAWCIKNIPMARLLLFMYMFTPMIIQQASAISADSFINMFSILFITYVLCLKFKDIKFNAKRKIVFFILAFCVSYTKHVYFALVFLSAIFIFDKKFSKKDKIYVGIVIILMSIIAISWYFITSFYVDTRDYLVKNYVNAEEQVKYLKEKPLSLIDTYANTLSECGVEYLNGFLGYRLGTVKIKINSLILYLYLYVMLLTPFLEKNKYALNKYEKIWSILIFVGIFCAILLGLYIGWSVVRSNLVLGIQGRYFIPIALLPLLCLVVKDKYIDLKNVKKCISLLVSGVNIYAIIKIIAFYLI